MSELVVGMKMVEDWKYSTRWKLAISKELISIKPPMYRLNGIYLHWRSINSGRIRENAMNQFKSLCFMHKYSEWSIFFCLDSNHSIH